jgi:hypothetical protein
MADLKEHPSSSGIRAPAFSESAAPSRPHRIAIGLSAVPATVPLILFVVAT